MEQRVGWIRTVLALALALQGSTRWRGVSVSAFLVQPSSPQPNGVALCNKRQVPPSFQRQRIYRSTLYADRKSDNEMKTPKKSHKQKKTNGIQNVANSSLPRMVVSSNNTVPSSSSGNAEGVQSLLDEPIQLDFVLNDFDLKALSSKVSYFYLRHELGLSEELMWKITHDAASVLGMTAANIRQKVKVLQAAMNLSIEDTKVIIERQPSLLQLSAKNNLSPTLDWLMESLKLSKKELRQLVVSQPSLLTYAQSNLQYKLQFFTTTRGLGFSVDECRKLVLEEPRLWTCGVKTGLLPRVRFLLHEIGIPKDKLRVAVQKNPRLLLYSLRDNLAPKLVHYGIMTLHMEPTTDLVKLLTTYPRIFDYNLERHILPITWYFLNDLDYSAHEFRAILLKFPRLMTYSLRKMKHVVGYLRYELGLDGAGVKRVLYQAPQVLGLDTEGNLTPKVQFLQQFTTSGEGDEEEQRQVVRRVIVGMPTVLNLSVEANLKPKLEYLEKMLRTENAGDESQQNVMRETILRAPALLGYSLDKRIRPRMEEIVDAGLPASSITVGITMTAAKFQTWLTGRIKHKSKQAIVLNGNQGPIALQSTRMKQTKDEKGITGDTLPDPSARVVHWKRERNPT